MFAPNSTPSAESDGNACTTAEGMGQGVGDQSDMIKTCPPADECNGVCDTTTGKCTPKTSTPCTDSDGNTCTTRAGERRAGKDERSGCVQTHTYASYIMPCAESYMYNCH